MRRRRTRESEESEVNLTPMLDVVFIMLIFFIVTASFVKEAGVDVNRADGRRRRSGKREAATSWSRSPPTTRSGSTAGPWIRALFAPTSNACTRRTPTAPW